VVICLERGADLQIMVQLMPLPLTVSCFSKIHIGFTFLVVLALVYIGIGIYCLQCFDAVGWFPLFLLITYLACICVKPSVL